MMLTSLFVCLTFFLIFARPINSQCTATEYMKSCSLQSNGEILKVFGDELLVGTANALVSYGLDLQLRVTVNLSSSDNVLQTCVLDGYSPESCKNFIKVIEPIPGSNKILVCGTNSYFPKCTLHNKNKLTNFTTLSSDNAVDVGFSPHLSHDFIISLVTSNKRFFSATRFTLNVAQTTIGMSPNPLLGDNHFTVRVSASTNSKLLNLPIRYISAHEYEDYVYFFITESALELVQKTSDMTSKQQYARAIRICKADNGIGNTNSELNRFLTFQKARLECKVGEGNGFDYTYYYDHLKSTFVGYEDGNPVLYGTFNSPSNGPKGGAICKFSFPGSLTSVFEDGHYNVRTKVDDRYVWTKETTQPFTCSSSRTTEDANKYDFVYNPVSSRPLFVTGGEFLDKIAAETVTYGGEVQEVLFFSNQHGQVKQLVLSSANPGVSFVHPIIMDSETNGNGNMEEVQKLILRNETGGTRSLYVSRGRKIMQIYKGRCDQYADCQGCLASHDPYCAWKSTTAACVNKVLENSLENLSQSFSSSKSDITRICMISTDPPDFTGSPTASNSGPTTTDAVITPDVEGLDGGHTKQVSVYIVVGSSIGAFFVGLSVGLAICFSFIFKKRISSKRKSLEVHDGKNHTPSAMSYRNCVAVGSNTATTVNTELVFVQVKKDDLNNCSNSKASDADPSSAKIDLALKPTPPPRYVDHPLQSLPLAPQPVAFSAVSNCNGGVVDLPAVNTNVSSHPANGVAVDSSITFPKHKRSNSKDVNKFDFTMEEEGEDSAFGDTVPPLKSFPTNSMYDSMKRTNDSRHNGGGGSNGITRKKVPKHNIPYGRTSSTTWLRESSVSSDVSP